MKKKYINPEVEAIEAELLTVLCISGDIDDDASEPALAPELIDFDKLFPGQIESDELLF